MANEIAPEAQAPRQQQAQMNPLEQKYSGEAQEVTALLANHDYAAAATRLRADAQLQPHELNAFMKMVQADVQAAGLQDVTITNDFKKGIAVQVTDENGPKKLLDKSPEALAKATDERVPRVGDIWSNPKYVQPPLDKSVTEAAFKLQQEMDKQGQHVLIGQILTDPKFGLVDGNDAAAMALRQKQVKTGLNVQEDLHAQQIADDLGRAMPLQAGEGYYQAIKRQQPSLTDQEAVMLAHQIRDLNGGKTNLHIGEQFAVMTDEQKANLKEYVRSQLHAETEKQDHHEPYHPGVEVQPFTF